VEKIALLFAGQRGQSVGMGRDLAEQFFVAADLFRQADEILGRKLSEIAWNGPIEELTKAPNCQRTRLACWRRRLRRGELSLGCRRCDKTRFGETPKLTRRTRALQNVVAR